MEEFKLLSIEDVAAEKLFTSRGYNKEVLQLKLEEYSRYPFIAYSDGDVVKLYDLRKLCDIKAFEEKFDLQVPVKFLNSLELEEDTIIEYADRINWDKMSQHKLSDSLMRQFKYKLNWNKIVKYQKLSEEFIEEFYKFLDMILVTKYQKISEDFILRHSDDIDFAYAYRYQNLSEEFMKDHEEEYFRDL